MAPTPKSRFGNGLQNGVHLCSDPSLASKPQHLCVRALQLNGATRGTKAGTIFATDTYVRAFLILQ